LRGAILRSYRVDAEIGGIGGVRKALFILQAALYLALSGASPDLCAHDEHLAGGETVRVLGKISFPTTAKSAEAQQAFIRGMLLLHLFEYPSAREEFIRAQEIEPGFAMAYWGEAMTYNHPIWDQQDLQAGRAALRKLAKTSELRRASTRDPREQGFLAAIDRLYGQGSKAERDRVYARAMEQMAARFPEDHEVQLFYALSLFGVQAGVRDIPTYMLCTAIAQAVFSANPQHPGAAHYLIHGVDDPDHAVLGLAAARALARMAPDSAHALHMTSHIFTALGMWDDVVQANEAAVKVQNRMSLQRGLKPRHTGHYNFWLLYGYLQQGRMEQARTLLTKARQEVQAGHAVLQDRVNLDPDESALGSLVQMWTRYLIESKDWNGEIAQWSFDLGDAFDPGLNFSFVQSMRAAQAGRADQAGQYLEQFRRLKAGLEHALQAEQESAPTDLLYLQRLGVLEQELLALVENARGNSSAAVGYAREASRLEGEMPHAFGPPFIDWPAAELLGQTLLQAHLYADAAAAFDLQLKRARLRAQSLLGLARSQQRLGHADEANYSLGKLRLIWRNADKAVKAELTRPAAP